MFGDCFLYTCCKQRRKSGRPTQLRSLTGGSLILFGSHVRGRFAVDTVFVVDDHFDYETLSDVPADAVPESYVHTTLRPMYQMDPQYCDPEHVGWRLYRGATPSRPRGGMFSFVPARPVDSAEPKGFARPTVILEGLITPSLRQGYKITPLQGAAVRSVWNRVVDQVVDQDLVLAAHLDCPPIETPAVGGDSFRAICI